MSEGKTLMPMSLALFKEDITLRFVVVILQCWSLDWS